jgi:hypothetical protein
MKVAQHKTVYIRVTPIAEIPLKRRKPRRNDQNPHCKLRKTPQIERYDIVLGLYDGFINI